MDLVILIFDSKRERKFVSNHLDFFTWVTSYFGLIYMCICTNVILKIQFYAFMLSHEHRYVKKDVRNIYKNLQRNIYVLILFVLLRWFFFAYKFSAFDSRISNFFWDLYFFLYTNIEFIDAFVYHEKSPTR